MENTLLLLLSVFPSLVLGYIIYRQDKIEKEPFYLLARLLVGGVLAVILTLIISSFIPGALADISRISFVTVFLYQFLAVGLVEEISKWVLLRIFTWESKEFKHIYDAVVYSVFIALGFATLENVLYVFSAMYTKDGSFLMGFETGILRSVLSVPGHAFFGTMMGYYYGLAKQAMLLGKTDLFEKNIRKSIFIPALLHGIFDALLITGNNLLFIIFLGFVVFLYVIAIRKIIQFSKISVNMEKLDPKIYQSPLFDNRYRSAKIRNSKVCTNCSYPNELNSNFCIRCGYRL